MLAPTVSIIQRFHCSTIDNIYMYVYHRVSLHACVGTCAPLTKTGIHFDINTTLYYSDNIDQNSEEAAHTTF